MPQPKIKYQSLNKAAATLKDSKEIAAAGGQIKT
jgi:hypothetical protein